MCIRVLSRARTCERMRVYVRACVRVRAGAHARLACVGERYAVPRGAIRRITGRDTPYLFLDLPEGVKIFAEFFRGLKALEG